MTDKEFKKLIKRTKKAQIKYFQFLDEAEQEYERRFGNNPSDVDDDYWIDTMHYPQGELYCQELLRQAKESKKSK